MAFNCKILADSVNQSGNRLTTFEITFPRVILAELNTHRMLSRNAASSRAIPTKKLIQRVLDDPFIPEFRLNQKGMQAGDALAEDHSQDAVKHWLEQRDRAVATARSMHEFNIHKQYVNRLLEPWMWATVIVSATDWQNFFSLRCHPDAEPSFQRIATMMREAREASEPVSLAEGEWHRPLMFTEDRDEVRFYLTSPEWNDPVDPTEVDDELVDEYLNWVCVGRCARVSYLTHDGIRDIVADIELAKRLSKSGHWSPFEHVACASSGDRYGNFNGWWQFRKLFVCEGWEGGAAYMSRADEPKPDLSGEPLSMDAEIELSRTVPDFIRNHRKQEGE